MLTKQEKYLITFENCDYYIDLGIHIAYFRKKAGFTQQRLADELHVHRTYLSRIESPNQNAHISFDRFFMICRILNVPPKCFFEPLPEQ
ncbi:MAG: helix-turn-helix domain-containing protein [Lachnospiraceae bacterium]|nr:helix-turn-helix transcriptional regulator [Lachnospiraceae bacterium]MDE6759591.1 helix-turn-helix domain-containing protein [Lachnospiraceae bacterium]